MSLNMEETISQVRTAILGGRTDIVNTVLESCSKYGISGSNLRNKILQENVVAEGTFLHLATKLNFQDVIRALLMAGADPTVENKHGENPFELALSDVIQHVYVEELLRATANSDLRRMDDLIKSGLDPNSWDCDEKRNSILHWAVSFANPATVSYVIGKGAEVNAETTEGVTPLHDAIDRGNVEIIEILLLANASPLIKAEKGKYANQSPLDLASNKPDVFSLVSHTLAAQFKNRTKRSSSIDSVAMFGNGPESPIFPKDSHVFRSSPNERQRHQSGSVSTDYVPIHNGFNPALEGVIRSLELKAPIQPIVTDSHLSLLWPQPKSLNQLEGLHFRPEKVLHVSVVRTKTSVHRILDVFSCHKEILAELGFRAIAQQVEDVHNSRVNNSYNHSSLIQCCVNSDILQVPGSYRLHVFSQKVSAKVRIIAADLQGLHYAICTFLQLLTLYSNENEQTCIPPVIINDHPSLKHRAVFIDVSQERIPTIGSICELIQTMSLVKMNYLHLHMRFDKTGTLIAYTKGEIVAIDRQCDDAGITLVPAIDISCGISVKDYLTGIKPFIKDLLPCFSSSKFIHVGPQLTTLMFSAEVTAGNPDAGFSIIWDFIPVSPVDAIVLLCYNAIRPRLMNPTLLSNVPSNIILIEYGFQADYNFGPAMQELTQNSCGSLVCAGTSAWSSLAGCPEASLCNVYHGTMNAVNNSALGLIVANWSGSCNLTPKIFAWPGFLLASGLAWNHQTHWEYLQGSLASLLNTYVFKDKSGLTGQIILQLGCTESNLLRAGLNQSPNNVTNLPPSDGTILYRLLTDPDNVPLEHLSLDSFIKCIRSIKKCQGSLLVDSKLNRDNNSVFDELSLTMEMMLLSCRIGRSLVAAGVNPRSNMGLTVVNLGISNLAPTVRTDIANKLLILTEEYHRVWMLQNYSQGLETSLYTLTTVLQRFIPDSSRLLAGRLSSSFSHSLSLNGTNGYDGHSVVA